MGSEKEDVVSAPGGCVKEEEMKAENMFYEEDHMKAQCPECGGDARYWELAVENDGRLYDTLVCDKCNCSWSRVYTYAWSLKQED